MKDELGAKFKPSIEPYWNETNLSERLSNCLAIFSSLTVLFWKLIPKTSADWFINIILVQDCQENPPSPFAVLYTCVNCVRWFSESDVKDKCWLFRFSLTFSRKERRDYRRMVAGRWRRTSRGAEMSFQWVSTLKHKIRKGGAEGIQLHLAHSYTDAYDKLQWQLSSHEKALSCAEKCCYVGRDIIHTWRNSHTGVLSIIFSDVISESRTRTTRHKLPEALEVYSSQSTTARAVPKERNHTKKKVSIW